MKPTKHPGLILCVAILTAAMACALPGLDPGPAPLVDPNALSTVIAGTAGAAAAQTQMAAGGEASLLAPTLTPTPTQMPVASATGGPVYSLYDTALVQQADGSVLLLDRKGGFQVVFPADWMIMRINEPEYLGAFASEAAATPVVHQVLTKLQDADLNIVRLTALDTRPGHIVEEIVSFLSVQLYYDDLRTLEEWDEVLANDALPFDNFKQIGSSYQTSAGGFRYLVWERSWAGHVGTIYEKGAYFSLPTGTVQIGLSTNLNFRQTIDPEFLAAVDSLQLFNP